MDTLRRLFSHFATWYVIGYLVVIAGFSFSFWQNGRARNQRTRELCYAQVQSDEKLIIVSAQSNDPPDPDQDRLLVLFRKLGRESLPLLCQSDYEQMRQRAIKELEKSLKGFLITK